MFWRHLCIWYDGGGSSTGCALGHPRGWMPELFGGLPEQAVPPAPGRGTPRLRQPERDQPGWQILALDDLVMPDHPVRAVWGFVQMLDLQPLHEAVKAREGRPGQAPAVPEWLLALWLWAPVEGMGRARQLKR